jgi:3-oxoacyl-[acyl-carrier-protein] synthase-1
VIAIEAAGAITPVGLNLVDTMVGLYTRVQLFEDLQVLDEDGEPLSGMKVRFEDDLAGPERIAAMAHAIVDEATLTIAPTKAIPLILCCPEPDAFGDDATGWIERLLPDLVSGAAVPIDADRSDVIARGRAGVLEAVGAALAMLQDSSTPYCLLGGVDCFVDGVRVERLLTERRIVTQSNKDGYRPGEAGAMLLLTNRPSPEAMASWLGAASGNDEAFRGSPHPITGAGLQDAISKALSQAQVPFETVAGLIPDFSGEQRYFEELLLATSRLARQQAANSVEVPALCAGETGASAGPLAMAMAAFLHWKGAHKRPSVSILSCDGAERGAVVLGPPPGRR